VKAVNAWFRVNATIPTTPVLPETEFQKAMSMEVQP